MLYDDVQTLTHLQSVLDVSSLCLGLTLHTAGSLQCPQAPAHTVLQQNRRSREPQLLYGSDSENKSKMSKQSFLQVLLKQFVLAP